MPTNVEKSRRYYDSNGNLLLSVENGADAVNVDFAPGNSGMESTNVQSAIIEAYNHGGGECQVNNTDEQEVFLGRMVKDDVWVRQKDAVSVVDFAITYTFHLPDDIVAKIQYGVVGENGASLTSNSGNKFNCDTFTFPRMTDAHKIYFARYMNGSTTSLSKDDCDEMIANGSIRVTYKDKDVITHNLAKEPMLMALTKLTFNERNDSSSKYWYKKAPLIAHTSDLHGDAQRMWNMCKFAKHYGIDECVVSGDATLYQKDGTSYVFAAAEKAGVHVCFCMGNHEAQGLTASAGVMYSTYLADDAETLGYLKAENTITDRGYYYFDIASKLIRFIVLDQYDGGVYGGTGNAGRISQAQLDFFVSALKNTPEGYGVIVVMHSPEMAITTPSGMEKFATTTPRSGNDGDNYNYGANGLYVDSSHPISKIIDAFISKGTYTGSWTQTSYSYSSESISVDADFSDVDESVEFICYMSGHIHTDHVGYLVGTTNRQLMLNITSGNGHVTNTIGFTGWAGVDDIPRRGVGVTQDAFNVYAIDRTNKQVRIMRIGSNVKKDFTMRDWMIIDYSPSAS